MHAVAALFKAQKTLKLICAQHRIDMSNGPHELLIDEMRLAVHNGDWQIVKQFYSITQIKKMTARVEEVKAKILE